MKKKILVYGSGGFGKEIVWLIDSTDEFEMVGFIDDTVNLQGSLIVDMPVYGFDAAVIQYPEACVVIAQGNSKNRELLANKIKNVGMKLATLIHPRTEISRRVVYGEGTVICAGNSITVDISMGENTQINLNCTIGHDVVMGDYCTLSPGVHISGHVHMGNRVFVGTGAVIINGSKDSPLIIEDDVVIGASSCVTKSLKAGNTYVGIPARLVGGKLGA